MDFSDYRRHDALGLAALVAADEVTPAELLATALERLAVVQPWLRPVSLDETAFAEAALAAGLPDGPFKGVPFLLKDLFTFVPGTRLTNGSRLFGTLECSFESTLVARYRKAGLVVFGKTASPELGVNVTTEPLVHGPVRNPWNPGHSAGGSSGGAAVAVAAGVVPAAHASDGGGSIRIPASACGLVGLKPSRARNPVGPMVGEAWNGLAGGHVISRTVRDTAAFLDATAGPEPGDPYACPPAARPFLEAATREPGALRIGLVTEAPGGIPVDPACTAAVERVALKLQALGHGIEPLALGLDGERLMRHQLAIVAVNLANDLDGWQRALGRPVDATTLEACTLALAERGRGIPAPDFAAAIGGVHQLARQFGRHFQTVDLLLSPTLAMPTPPLGLLDQNMADLDRFLGLNAALIPFTPLYNMTGCPAISLPLEHAADGLPIGVMLGAALGREELLIQVAGQLERAHPWFDRVPPDPAWREVSAA
jgi:Asp-tRNA(Asn)/Glu-tRNA(Gln) amidotransferase A subunit family amidase